MEKVKLVPANAGMEKEGQETAIFYYRIYFAVLLDCKFFIFDIIM